MIYQILITFQKYYNSKFQCSSKSFVYNMKRKFRIIQIYHSCLHKSVSKENHKNSLLLIAPWIRNNSILMQITNETCSMIQWMWKLSMATKITLFFYWHHPLDTRSLKRMLPCGVERRKFWINWWCPAWVHLTQNK